MCKKLFGAICSISFEFKNNHKITRYLLFRCTIFNVVKLSQRIIIAVLNKNCGEIYNYLTHLNSFVCELDLKWVGKGWGNLRRCCHPNIFTYGSQTKSDANFSFQHC
jgi:hypothetical protein